jgi:CHAT domain-containing protein
MRLQQVNPDEGLAGDALAASERARARSLLENLAEAQIDVHGGADPDLRDRERRLRRALDGKSERLMRVLGSPGGGDEAARLEEEIARLTSRYDLLKAEIRSKSPRYAALTQPQPLDLAQIQRKVLDSETLLLEYALGEERSYLWAVSQGELRSHVLPSRMEIEKAARHLRGLLTARLLVRGARAQERRRIREADGAYWASAAALSEVLLGPVAEAISGKRLLIVSDGALQYLPFAALPAPGTTEDPVPLIVENEIVHLPSVSALSVLREETGGREHSGRTVAVLADPVFELDDPRLYSKTVAARETAAASMETESLRAEPLRSSSTQRALRAVGFVHNDVLSIPRLVATRGEAKAITAIAPPGTSFMAIDFDANLATAKDPELGHYPIVHFATHGLVNSENPGLSGILLSMVDENGTHQPGFLRLDDIYNLELPVELVVLSACSTALGKEIRGEGLVGIVQGFMYAGAKRVVASLWKVDDYATGELMSRFYRQMLEQKRSPAGALRQAQIEMWRKREFRQPFYWAAFVLQGEWR